MSALLYFVSAHTESCMPAYLSNYTQTYGDFILLVIEMFSTGKTGLNTSRFAVKSV